MIRQPPVAASPTDAPLPGSPAASRATTVIVAGLAPATIVAGAAVTADCAAGTPPGVTVTAAVCVTPTPFTPADTVFVSATVEESAPVATPLAFVAAVGWASVFPLPVAASTTVAPLTGFPLVSRAVTVIAADPPPAAIVAGAAASVDWVPETAPAVTVTVAVCVIAVEFTVADTVFDSATVEASVPVATPFTSVAALGCLRVSLRPVASTHYSSPATWLPP